MIRDAMGEMISLRLPKKITGELDRLSELEDKDRSELIREILSEGIKEKKIGDAVTLYAKGKVSLSKAAELAEISVWMMIDILRQRKVEAQYSEKELEEDIELLLSS